MAKIKTPVATDIRGEIWHKKVRDGYLRIAERHRTFIGPPKEPEPRHPYHDISPTEERIEPGEKPPVEVVKRQETVRIKRDNPHRPSMFKIRK